MNGNKWMAMLCCSIMMIMLLQMDFDLGVKAESEYVDHDPITIIGNDGFTSQNGVSGGSGSQQDPYMIEDLDIDADALNFGIYVKDTTKSFVIRNCVIHDARDPGSDFSESTTINYKGIMLENVDNAVIENNTFYGNYYDDIFLYFSSNCTIRNNTLSSSIGENNIRLEDSNDNIIEYNICDPGKIPGGNITRVSHKQYGIFLRYRSSRNIVRNNIVNNHTVDGISINNNYNNHNIILNNIAKYNQNGIRAGDLNVTVRSNICNSNTRYGISIRGPEYGLIEKNLCKWNGEVGIHADDPAEPGQVSVIRHNICENNTEMGLYATGSDYEIHNNSFSNNGFNGVQIRDKNNVVRDNTIRGNSEYGLYIEILHGNPSSSSGNKIFRNNMIDNGRSVQGYDDGQDNSWNSTEIGNYWSDWRSPDSDNDSIVDDPYVIDDSDEIYDHLPSAHPFPINISILKNTTPVPIVNDTNDNQTQPEDDDPDDNSTEPNDNDTIEWTNETNTAPQSADINISDIVLMEGESFFLSASAVDPDIEMGDVLTYEWYIDGMGLVGTGDQLEIMLDSGAYTIHLKVIDEYGKELVITKEIEVQKDEKQDKGPMITVIILIIVIILLLMVLGGFILRKRNGTKDGSSRDHLDIPGDVSVSNAGPGSLKGSLNAGGELKMPRDHPLDGSIRSGKINVPEGPLFHDEQELGLKRLKSDLFTGPKPPTGKRKEHLWELYKEREGELDEETREAVKAILGNES